MSGVLSEFSKALQSTLGYGDATVVVRMIADCSNHPLGQLLQAIQLRQVGMSLSERQSWWIRQPAGFMDGVAHVG